MDRIKATPEDLMCLSVKLGGVSDSITNNLLVIKRLMDELNYSWESEVSIAHIKEIESEMYHSKNLVQTLKKLSEELMELGQAYQASEADMSSKIAGMFDKDTFT